MLKKRLIMIAVVFSILLVQCTVSASPVDFPFEPNTTAEINFPGIAWYSDFETVMQALRDKRFNADEALLDIGFSERVYTTVDFDPSHLGITPHWDTFQDVNSYSSGMEFGCGGEVRKVGNLPDIEGYKVYCLLLSFMWNPEAGAPADYKAPDACQFYMGKYVFAFDLPDAGAAYDNLSAKLGKLYGDSPFTGETDYLKASLWLNESHALISLALKNKQVIILTYMAPGAENRLVQVEEMVRQKEAEQAADDLSGL